MKPILKTGTYQHYKGSQYQVIDLAIHSETEQWMVLYRPLYGEAELWVRPYEMFIENVVIAGEEIPRFEFVKA
ncbi:MULTISPECIES: DUF1653 domain-containing protein [unclassified Motilimonas]|uniref:DUF1653 domain-containing protein n=1 Tax=Motilimonas TaxID=1914248 RepID=UPI001E2E93E2|nr:MULTISPECIES: DUF1653 domain-containing protein [unclassified Motilimonas]MCE0556634.1 DUF1653 domain-containing protein [Motilimonas sp. E26]MDO6524799.1 DUF1653 domain-containing protein [Motilimonas sp. 1_MG-2023]